MINSQGNNNTANMLEDIYINDRLFSWASTSDLMMMKLLEIMKYRNLPLSIDRHEMEDALLRNGAVLIYKFEDNIFSCNAPVGDSKVFNVNHGDETLKLTRGVDCVLIKNDYLMNGVETIVGEYSVLTAQAKITIKRNLEDLRGNYIVQAKDENAYRSALEFMDALRRGEQSVILAEEFHEMDGLLVHNTPISNNPATQTIELFNFVNSYYYSEFGININNNMKREYVSETEMSKTSGMPFIYHMLSCRQNGITLVNALFGTDIEVNLSDAWDDEQEVKEDASEITQPQPGEDGEEASEKASGEKTETNSETNSGMIDASGEEVPDVIEEDVRALYKRIFKRDMPIGGVNYGEESNSTAESTAESDGDVPVHGDGSDSSEVPNSGGIDEAGVDVSTTRKIQSEHEDQESSSSDVKENTLEEDEEDEN